MDVAVVMCHAEDFNDVSGALFLSLAGFIPAVCEDVYVTE